MMQTTRDACEMVQNHTYRVALLSRPRDVARLGEALQQILRMTHTDAMILAHRVPGVLNEVLNSEQADALAVAARRLEIPAAVLQPQQVPDFVNAHVVHHLRWNRVGLECVNIRGEAELRIPWSALRLICVGELPLDNIASFPSGEMSLLTAGNYRNPARGEVQTLPSLEVRIECEAPYPNLRIDHRRMNYDCLGERRSASAGCNFRALIECLLQRAPQAVPSESTAAYLQNGDHQRYRFASSADFVHYATWQAIAAREPRLEDRRNMP